MTTRAMPERRRRAARAAAYAAKLARRGNVLADERAFPLLTEIMVAAEAQAKRAPSARALSLRGHRYRLAGTTAGRLVVLDRDGAAVISTGFGWLW